MLSLLLIAAVFSHKIVDEINSDPTSTWTAVEYPREVLTHAKMISRIGVKLSHLPAEPYIPRNDLPEDFDARTKWGKKILPVRNQASCGSCWAFSVSECISDRLEIAGKGKGNLSPQDLVSCDTRDQGCNGGEFETSFSWCVDNGIATDACLPYVSGSGRVPSCPTKCNNGSAIERTKIRSYKQLSTNDAQVEIQNNGPISAGFIVYMDFQFYKSGVYKHKLPVKEGGHAILVIGWGVEKGTPYWLCQNSWGDTWGMQGHFKILRGSNECDIESNMFTAEI